VRLLEQSGTTNTTRYTSSLDNLAAAYSGAGRLPEALATQRRVTEASRGLGRGETIGAVVSLQDEGVFLRRLGRWLEADERFRKAAELASGADRAGRVPGYLLVNHARLLGELGRGDAARAALQRARAQGDLTARFSAVGELADALLSIEEGDVGRARTLLEALQPVDRSPLPGTQRHNVAILAALVLRAEGRVVEARTMVNRAIEESGFPTVLSATQPELLECAARLSVELGDVDAAIQGSRNAIRVADGQFGRDIANAHVGRARLTLATALAAKGSVSEARTELEQAVASLEQSSGAAHPWTVEAQARLAALKK
jgi:tetratricopeptide (TPR) repeat protein